MRTRKMRRIWYINTNRGKTQTRTTHKHTNITRKHIAHRQNRTELELHNFHKTQCTTTMTKIVDSHLSPYSYHTAHVQTNVFVCDSLRDNKWDDDDDQKHPNSAEARGT